MIEFTKVRFIKVIIPLTSYIGFSFKMNITFIVN